MGILICGLNGTGKSTLGRMLAERLGYCFIDNEDLFFPRTDPSYEFSDPRSKEEVIQMLEDRIAQDDHFVFAAVKGDYGDKLISSLQKVVLIEAPKSVRNHRVRERSSRRFGDRILRGGDLYEKEESFFAMVENRPEDYVSQWLDSVNCPVIRVDGTIPLEKNVDHLVSILT